MNDLFQEEIPNPMLLRIRIKNYKSISVCDVKPGKLTFLVGRNGSGKSNLVDALSFVRDSLESSVEHALERRGGINDVRRRSTGHPNHFSMRLDLSITVSLRASYFFRIGSKKGGGFVIQEERCEVKDETLGQKWFYEVKEGKVGKTSIEAPPAFADDRLFLVAASGFTEFRPVYDALTSMTFHNPIPSNIRDLSKADSGEKLRSDGDNLASVFGKLEDVRRTEILELLQQIVPDVVGVEKRSIAGNDALEFKQTVKGSQHPWTFFANSMSDGTLRALGILTALFHNRGGDAARGSRLVALEEPEAALHPAAAAVLFEALLQASHRRQVIVTSHSPDLLDQENVEDCMILAVENDSGVTVIGGISEALRDSLKEHLYTAGELLRQDLIRPDPKRALEEGTTEQQLGMFESL